MRLKSTQKLYYRCIDDLYAYIDQIESEAKVVLTVDHKPHMRAMVDKIFDAVERDLRRQIDRGEQNISSYLF